jgi:hypothetical protein
MKAASRPDKAASTRVRVPLILSPMISIGKPLSSLYSIADQQGKEG